MEFRHPMERGRGVCGTDHGPGPFAANIQAEARKNQNFRTAFWTGEHLQMTLMCIPPCGEVGMEIHHDMDQYIRVEEGQAIVCMGARKEKPEFRRRLDTGDAFFVPSGTWHNIQNTGKCSLKLSSIYGPPHHPRGTVHPTKADAEKADY